MKETEIKEGVNCGILNAIMKEKHIQAAALVRGADWPDDSLADIADRILYAENWMGSSKTKKSWLINACASILRKLEEME